MSHSFVVSSPSTAYKSLSTTSITTKIKKFLKIPKEIIKAKELKNDKELKKYQELKSCEKWQSLNCSKLYLNIIKFIEIVEYGSIYIRK